MYKVLIKPLSLNQAYRGRRFATKELLVFKRDFALLCPKTIGKRADLSKLRAIYEFGVSSKSADGDNLIKVCQDSLSERYGFNDKQIYEWHVKKVDVPKGQEYISFALEPMLE